MVPGTGFLKLPVGTWLTGVCVTLPLLSVYAIRFVPPAVSGRIVPELLPRRGASPAGHLPGSVARAQDRSAGLTRGANSPTLESIRYVMAKFAW